MSKPKITDVWELGVNPINQELVIYPKSERPPYPKRNECPKCWEENGSFVRGKLERHEFIHSIHRIYECPKCHYRWEGQRTKKKD